MLLVYNKNQFLRKPLLSYMEIDWGFPWTDCISGWPIVLPQPHPHYKIFLCGIFHSTCRMGGTEANKLIFLIFNMLLLIDMEIMRISFHTHTHTYTPFPSSPSKSQGPGGWMIIKKATWHFVFLRKTHFFMTYGCVCVFFNRLIKTYLLTLGI